jgi:two-component system, OmpR family, phosphate regulon sensor histidine kinase PhoR
LKFSGRHLRSIILLAGLVLLALAIFDAPRWLAAFAGTALLATGALALVNRAAKRPQIPPVITGEPLALRLGRLLDAVPAPLIVTDKRSIVVMANLAARTVYPALRNDAPLSFAIRNPQLLQSLDRAITDLAAIDLDLIERVPVERSFAVRIEPIRGRNDAPEQREAALISMLDTTSTRRTEQMRVDFVANASHELRTPLASIMGFVETLQGAARNDPTVRDRFLAIMAQQGQRMARLIDDLLSLSRIELSAHLLPEDEIEIIELLRGVIDGLSALAYERGVRLDFIDGSQVQATVQGARDELIRVFENLIENAIKYGQSGGKVEISARRMAEAIPELHIAIRDFGPGINPEHLPRLTERFYRVDVASSRDKGGTGLGLAIVKHILNRHRGKLLIESEPGKGAVFSVKLPIRERTLQDIDKTTKILSQN